MDSRDSSRLLIVLLLDVWIDFAETLCSSTARNKVIWRLRWNKTFGPRLTNTLRYYSSPWTQIWSLHCRIANQGKFLHIIAKMCSASRILEIGTLGGHSTIWLARAPPKWGSLVTLEVNPINAAVAKKNISRTGVSEAVEVLEKPALESLEVLVANGAQPFDLIFIDADKPSNPSYLEWAMKLSKKGTIIAGDNVVRNGAVCDPRLCATAIQTVGSKGWDGFTIARVEWI